MSTIRVDNFGPSAGGTTYSARGIAKAWVNFNGTGTIAARDSENVSSLTDNGTGNYDVDFTNAMADVNYSTTTTAGGSTGEVFASIGSTTYSTSVVQVRARTVLDAAQDPAIYCVSIHGDLA